MTPRDMIRSLAQMQGQAQLLAGSLEALRLSLEELQPPPPEPEEVDGKCQHPDPDPAPVMGNPGRKHCARCGEFV